MVLTKEEVKLLAKIKTSEKYARQIKRRNKAMLKAAEAMIANFDEIWGARNGDEDTHEYIYEQYDYGSDIGCPHCTLPSINCHDCAWWKVLRRPRCCLGVKFGGISARKVRYGLFYAVYDSRFEEVCISYEAAPKRKSTALKQLNNIITILKGHIEWADLALSGEI